MRTIVHRCVIATLAIFLAGCGGPSTTPGLAVASPSTHQIVASSASIGTATSSPMTDLPGHGPSASAPPATATPSSGPSARLAPTGYPGTGTIAFGRFDPTVSSNATWLIDPDGSHESAFRAANLWDGAIVLPGSGCCAVISPDGKSIAVGYDEHNQTGTWALSGILNLDGSDLAEIPSLCGSCGSIDRLNYVPRAWSPDGNLLAVEVWNDADPTRDGINLAPTCAANCDKAGSVCSANGCDWAVHVTGTHRDIPVAFSPDGTQLLFVRIDHDRLGTLMVTTIEPPDGATPPGDVRQISPAGMLVSADGAFGIPASWAPDGSRIAFAATDRSGDVQSMRAYVVASAGGAPIPLTAAGGSVSNANWSPDGMWIAFDRAIPGTETHDIFVIRANGSAETDLTTDFEPSICCARWSPDSKALLAAGMVTANDSDLFIVPISGAPIHQVTTVPGRYVDFSWGRASR